MLSIVPVDWVIACMVPLYKSKGDVHKCNNFRGTSSLSVVGKVYGRVLTNRIRDKFYQELLKEKNNPRLKGNRKGIIVKGKEFYIPILNTFPTR